MDDWRGIVGMNVRRFRQRAQLTQEQLAFAAEIDLTYVGGIERGKRNPSVLVLVRIAAALGTEPAELLKAVSK
ncbi:MAG: helix-turn-helix transcriptional regulator [Sphingobium sp.]|nr:helix-turn-helix transcriptional regulator [Sphingomonas sp.]WEK01295.1 MAG: helix-turn-helix transcriptional regulator [Sphingomonas sp.]